MALLSALAARDTRADVTEHAQATEPGGQTAQVTAETRAVAPGAATALAGPLTPESMVMLQRAAGNQAVARMVAAGAAPPMLPPSGVLARKPKKPAKKTEPGPLWSATPTDMGAEELARLLMSTLNSTAPENLTGTGKWVIFVITKGRISVHEDTTEAKALGTYRLASNARIPGDGYYLSYVGRDESDKTGTKTRWFSSRLGITPTDEEAWIPQGFGTKKNPGDVFLEDWVAKSDAAEIAKHVGPTPDRIGMIVAGYGEKSNAERAQSQLDRVRRLIGKLKAAAGVKGPGEAKEKGPGKSDADKPAPDPAPKSKDEKARDAAEKPKDLPDQVSVVEDRQGIHVQITVDGAKQGIPYKDGETDQALLDRIKKATAEVREQIDPSKSTKVQGAGEKPEISTTTGKGGVPLPEGFKPTAGAHVANAPAYPAVLVSHGSGGRSGSEHTVTGATVDFTMELNYSALSYGTADEVFNRLQPIAYKWELLDITDLKPDKVKEQLKKPGDKTESGIARDLARDLSNTWEDTKNDLSDIASNPGMLNYLSVVAISDLIQIGGALISSFFSAISQPLDERSIAFNKKGNFVLRCFAKPVDDDDMIEKIIERGGTPVIRAPSSAILPVTVSDINERAVSVNDEETTTIAKLEAGVKDPPFPYTAEEIQKKLDTARARVPLNTIQAADASVRDADDELGKIRRWRAYDDDKKPLDQRDDELRLWKAMLDVQEIQLGTYEERLRTSKKQLEEARKRYADFGLRGMQDGEKGVFRPRMTLVSEVNGGVFELRCNLGEAAGSKEGARRWRLIDVTSADSQDIYVGTGATHQEAIQKALYHFRDDSGYGRGSLAVRLPVDQIKAAKGEDVTVESVMRVRPGSKARALKRLQDLATAAEIASMVVTGPVGLAIGIAGGVAGGIVAAENLRRRAAAERLKADFQTGMDIIGVVGAVVAVGGPIAQSIAKGYKVEQAAAEAAGLAKVGVRMETLAKRATMIGDALHIVGTGMMHGQWIIIPLALAHQLHEIDEEERNNPNASKAKLRARRLEAWAGALKSGLVQVRTMQMQADPSKGWDPFAEKPTAKAPETGPTLPHDAPTEVKPAKPTDVTPTIPKEAPPVEPVKPSTDGPPKSPPSEPPTPARKPGKPQPTEPTFGAPGDPRPVGQQNLAQRVFEALGGASRGTDQPTQTIKLVDGTLLEAMRVATGKPPHPEGTIGVYGADTGILYISKDAFAASPDLQRVALDGVMQRMTKKGRQALSDPVARALGELAMQAAIEGAPPLKATTPEARALQQRLSIALGPEALMRVAFGGETAGFSSKLAEVYGSARGNAIEAALRGGDTRLAARLAGEPNAALSNAFGELAAVAAADMLAKASGGTPRDPARAALGEKLAATVGRDVVEGALFRGRTEDLRIRLEESIGKPAAKTLIEALRNNDLKAASAALDGRPTPGQKLPVEPIPLPEPKPSTAEKPATKPAPEPPPKAAPLQAKGAELRVGLTEGKAPDALHQQALEAISEVGSFKELRKQVNEGLFGSPKAVEALQQARMKLVDGVLAEIQRVIAERYPGVELVVSDLGTPGFNSDRDVTLKAKAKGNAKPTPNDLIAASVDGVRAAYDILNGKPGGPGDPFAKARELVGGRNFAPDRVLDSNFYTELHESLVKPRNAQERLAIVEDQSVVSLAEVRANMKDAAEWTAYKDRLLESFAKTDDGATGLEADINKFAKRRIEGQLKAAEALHAELHPQGVGAEQMLATVQQQLLDALKRNASPQEIRQLQAKIKLLEPDAYGTRAAVVGVVDQYQGAARADTSKKAWEALGSGKEPLTVREAAATTAQEAAASAGKLRHAAPDSGATTAQAVSAAKYLARIHEAFQKAGMRMKHPLIDRSGHVIGSKQEANAGAAAMGELNAWAQNTGRLGLDPQQVRDAFVKEVKALGEQLDARMRANEAVQAAMDPTTAEVAAGKEPPKGPPKVPPKDPGGDGPPSGGPPKKDPPKPTPDQLKEIADAVKKKAASNEERQAVIEQLRHVKGKPPGWLEGFVPQSLLKENQRAIKNVREKVLASSPDVVVGMERGGAFLAEVLGAGDPALAKKVVSMPVDENPAAVRDKKGKFAPEMAARFDALIAQGAKKIVIVDYYMGGKTAGDLSKLLVKHFSDPKYAGVTFEVHWIRETFGKDDAGGSVVEPPRGEVGEGKKGAGLYKQTFEMVPLAIGDDMHVVLDVPDAKQPIQVFDDNGQVVHTSTPGEGENTRRALVRLLNGG
jgi:adenine/guanine phosphoribosyltransferase-like PRPP-binding protein